MLEILFIILLFKRLKKAVEAKNQSGWLPWMAPLFWFGGQFSMAFLAGVVYVILGKNTDHAFALYGYALLGGILGGALAFLIVRLMPTKPLFCPSCGCAFTQRSEWGIKCEQCDSQLKIIKNKVSLIETAAADRPAGGPS